LAAKFAGGFSRLMRILLVATKPPWPLIDGGRVLLWHTMAGLVRHGAEITLVAPLDPASDGDAVGRELRTLCRPELVRHPQRTRVKAFAHALWGDAPVSIALHRFAAMRERVAALLAAEAFDLVHAEQLRAAALRGRRPVAALGNSARAAIAKRGEQSVARARCRPAGATPAHPARGAAAQRVGGAGGAALERDDCTDPERRREARNYAKAWCGAPARCWSPTMIRPRSPGGCSRYIGRSCT
jgi:hypothetical protein